MMKKSQRRRFHDDGGEVDDGTPQKPSMSTTSASAWSSSIRASSSSSWKMCVLLMLLLDLNHHHRRHHRHGQPFAAVAAWTTTSASRSTRNAAFRHGHAGPCPFSVERCSTTRSRTRTRRRSSCSSTRLFSHTTKEELGNDKFNLRLLLLDHYDSFTYNLVDAFAQLCHDPPIVLAADCASTWKQLHELLQSDTDDSYSFQLDGIVLSPGPGTPSSEKCALAMDIIKCNPNLPILGVCLGHQVMAHAYGATVTPMKMTNTTTDTDTDPLQQQHNKLLQPIHGQVWTLEPYNQHLESPLFQGVFEHDDQQQQQQRQPRIVQATRYHSLHVSDLSLQHLNYLNTTSTSAAAAASSLPLQALAHSQGDGVCMALQHETNPHYGVQFHPESIGTIMASFETGGTRISGNGIAGWRVLRNFCQICKEKQQQQDVHTDLSSSSSSSSSLPAFASSSAAAAASSNSRRKSSSNGILKSSTTTVANGQDATISSIVHATMKKKNGQRVNESNNNGSEEEKEDGVVHSRNGATLESRNGVAVARLKRNGVAGVSRKDADENHLPTTTTATTTTTPNNNHQHTVYIHKVAAAAAAVAASSSSSSTFMTTSRTGMMMMKPEQVMEAFLSECEYAFWLDTSHQSKDNNDDNDNDGGPFSSRDVSILGTATKEHGKLVEYFSCSSGTDQHPPNNKKKKLRVYDMGGNTCEVHEDLDILTYLQRQHEDPTRLVTLVSFAENDDDDDDDDNGGRQGQYPSTAAAAELMDYSEQQIQDQLLLPFDYRGGHVGYLGYEVRHDTSRYLQEQERGAESRKTNGGSSSAAASGETFVADEGMVPTAAFLWADRSFVYDHKNGDWYLVGVVTSCDNKAKEETLFWMRETAKQLCSTTDTSKGLGGYDYQPLVSAAEVGSVTSGSITIPSFVPNRSKETYNRNFDQCLEYIRQGESYELCLTNQLEATVQVPGSSPLDLYSVLRRRNPAPFSAFFNWNSQKTDKGPTSGSLAICCSSPERFVSVKRQQSSSIGQSSKLLVEAKPIKGTSARVMPSNGEIRTPEEAFQDSLCAEELKASVKNRAENLMIVDLLRNDLNRVCETGSVHVSKLMGIESFATVHQMVSTIRGKLDPEVSSAVDVLRVCFPGGSMTGAPKLRTVELLEDIEEGVSRGPYSGCLGYISSNGCMDMNIVIRTAILTSTARNNAWNVTIGAGGAITALSESADEYDEMLLKASAVINAVNEWAGRDNLPSAQEVSRRRAVKEQWLRGFSTRIALPAKQQTRDGLLQEGRMELE